jgi:hypothetical protein
MLSNMGSPAQKSTVFVRLFFDVANPPFSQVWAAGIRASDSFDKSGATKKLALLKLLRRGFRGSISEGFFVWAQHADIVGAMNILARGLSAGAPPAAGPGGLAIARSQVKPEATFRLI